MSIKSESFITHICVDTHAVADKTWFSGPGYYGCIVDGDHREWHGPYVDTQIARQEFGNVRVHSPAAGARSAS